MGFYSILRPCVAPRFCYLATLILTSEGGTCPAAWIVHALPRSTWFSICSTSVPMLNTSQKHKELLAEKHSECLQASCPLLDYSRLHSAAGCIHAYTRSITTASYHLRIWSSFCHLLAEWGFEPRTYHNRFLCLNHWAIKACGVYKRYNIF